MLFFFFCVISYFGFIILKIIEKRSISNNEANLFEKIILSFGIGLSIYVSLGFIFSVFKIMNFFTLYLPYLVIDFIFLFITLYRKRFNVNFSNLKKKIKNFKKRENIIFILIISFFYLLTFAILGYIIFYNELSLFGTDAFLWESNIEFLLDHGYITLNNMSYIYPQGFVVTFAGCLSLMGNPHYLLVYYFYKFAPFVMTFLYLTLFIYLLRKLYNNNLIIMIGLIIFSTLNYFQNRFLRFLPSNIGTIILLMVFITFISNFRLYYIGFLFALNFLIHPLSAYYLLLLFLILQILKLNNLKKNFKPMLKEFNKAIIIIILLITPFVIFLQCNNISIYNLLLNYLYQANIIDLESNNFLAFFLNPYTLRKIVIEFLSSWILNTETVGLWRINLYKDNTLIFSVFFFLLGVLSIFFFRRKYINEKYNNLILFGKGVIFIILFSFFLPLIFPNNIIQYIMLPFEKRIRLLEFFSGPVVIMECYSIYCIFQITRFIKKKKISRKNIFKSLKNKYISKTFNIRSILTLILLTSAFSNYYLNLHYNSYPGVIDYKFKPEEIESLFYIKENVPDSSKILVYDYESSRNVIYFNLYNYNYTLWNYEINESYNITKNYVNENNITFILISRLKIDAIEFNYFLNDTIRFIVLFQNSRNTIFRFIG